MQSLVLSILLFTPLALFGSDQDLKGGGDGEQPGKPPRGAAAPEPGGDPAPSDASALERWYPYPLQPPFIGDSYEGWDGVDIVYPGSATFQIGHEPAIPSALAILDSPGQEFRPGYFIVHFANPVSREAHLLLDGLSGKLRGPDGRELARWYIPNRALIAFVDSAGAYEQIAGSELVDWIGRYQPAYKLSALIGSTPLESPERLARHSYLLNVDLVPGHDHAGVAGAIRGLGARVVRRVYLPGKKTYDVHYLVVEAPPSRIVDIALLEGVRTIQEAGEGLRVHDLSGGGKLQSRTLSADDEADVPIVTAADFPLWLTHDLQGQGQLIGVVDTSIDWNNVGASGCAFGYPDSAIDNWGFALPNLARVLLGSVGSGGVNLKVPRADILGGATLQGSSAGEHGSGVSGAACGDFYADDDTRWWEHDVDNWESWAPTNYSGLLGPGIAHEAQLYFTPVLNSSGAFRWEFIGEFETNMSITLNNMAAAGVCTTNHSVGLNESNNTYTQTSVVHDTAGFDNPMMLQCMAAGNSGAVSNALTSQSVVKNNMSVGASDDVLRPEDRVTFSSIGPAFDGRLQPDIMAPGSDTFGRAGGVQSLLILPESNGTGSGSCAYQWTSGTSFSSPIMAGAGALVHQYFEEGRYGGATPITDPSAALMKAMLINGGHRLSGSNLGNGQYPNDYQGWGEPKLTDVLELPGGARSLIAHDLASAQGFNGPGDAPHSYDIAVSSSAERLRVTLAWTDEPGSAGQGKKLINDLHLTVTSPGATVYLGNVFNGGSGESVAGGSADTLNNTECVILSAPQAGTWTVTVDPSDGNYSVGQGYALVITGDVSEDVGPAPPSADFSGSPTSGTAPLAVSFTDLSSGSPSSWSWTFGDGGTSSAQNPAHTYNAAGTYDVSLTATNAAGSDNLTRTAYITVSAPPDPPVADFSGAPTSGTAPLAVSFTDLSSGSPSSWSWTFGDGGTSSAQSPAHTYNAAGSYDVSLTVTNAGGSDTLTRNSYITVTQGGFTGEGYILSRNPDYSTDDRAYDTSETIYMIVWSDQVDHTDMKKAEWELRDTGGNRVKQSLTDNGDGTFSAAFALAGLPSNDTLWTWKGKLEDNSATRYRPQDTITVTSGGGGNPPLADFSGSPTSGTAPLTVDFTDLSSGSPTSWSWDFGDGGTSSAQSPSHTYNAAGTYDVTLTVTNASGSDTLTRASYISVSAQGSPPVADFSGSPTAGTAPLTVEFTDQSTGSPTSWAWTFGDGGTSSAQNPTHIYNAEGTYDVTLTVTNANGSDTLTRTSYITVSAGGGYTGEGYILSKNPDFSTDDRVFSTSDTIYIIVWSDQVDHADMKKAEWELRDAGGNKIKRALTNNGDGTFTAAFDLGGLPSSDTAWTWKGKLEDRSGTRYRPQDSITVLP